MKKPIIKELLFNFNHVKGQGMENPISIKQISRMACDRQDTVVQRRRKTLTLEPVLVLNVRIRYFQCFQAKMYRWTPSGH